MNLKDYPPLFVAIGYDNVYDDFDEVNPLKLLEDIPTSAILRFVADRYANIFYAQSDIHTQRQHIREFCPYLPKKERQRVWNFIKHTEETGNHVFLYGSTGCLMLYRLALQSFTDSTPNEYEGICDDEYKSLFKAILYCNKMWTDQQVKDKGLSLRDISLTLDIPLVEGKQYKDFRPQLYKSYQFFTFCENDATFRKYLPFFMQDRSVNNWGDYLILLFGIYTKSITQKKLPLGNAYEQKFYSQFVINPEDKELKTIWDDGNKGIGYMRDHFLFKMSDASYLLLDANLLLDKLYQGLKFDLYNSVERHGLLNEKNKPYRDRGVFNSTLGKVFSEHHLLHILLKKTYSGGNCVGFSGNELNDRGIKDGEPDYYLRIGNAVYLFEYKDVLYKDEVRYSGDADKMGKLIRERICIDDGEHREGGGQLLYNIDRILNQGLLNDIDAGTKNINQIFPIIVTTDRAFSALGVNNVVIEAFDEIRRRKYKFNQDVMIYVPIIINLDSLIMLSYRLHTAKLQLGSLLIDYIKHNKGNISSFDNYVFDNCKETERERSEALEFLFTGLVNRMAQLIEGNGGTGTCSTRTRNWSPQ